MIKNTNFYNQFEITIEPTNRGKALSFFKTVSINRPGMMDQAKLRLIDQTDGRLTVMIDNTPAIDKQTLTVMRRFLYALKKC
jgi:hypothetical protein